MVNLLRPVSYTHLNLANKRLSKVMLLRVPLRLGFDVFSLGEVSDAKVMKLRTIRHRIKAEAPGKVIHPRIGCG